MIVMQDKRENPRVNICLSSSVKIENEDKRSFSIVKNISNTGMFFTSKKEYEMGSIADCIVSLEDEPIAFKGEVVRSLNDDRYYGYGLNITEINDRDYEKLDKFIEDSFYTIMNNVTDDARMEQACQENVLNFDRVGDYEGLGSDAEYIISDGADSRMLMAEFPYKASIADFDFNREGAETKLKVDEILKFEWVESAKNAMLFGPTQSGKTHLAIAIASKAIENDYKVSFTTLNNLLVMIRNERMSIDSSYRLNRLYDSRVIVIDEVGLRPLSREEANMFFQFVNKVYGKVSLLMTSDLTFEECKNSISDPVTVNLLLDRLEHNIWLKGLVN